MACDSTSERQYGIDLLRIISMCGIVGLHVINRGGVLMHPDESTLTIQGIRFIVIICYCSVNVFAMISGWLYVGRSVKYRTIKRLWIIVFFYCISITFLAYFIKPEIFSEIRIWIQGFLPELYGRYWYIVCYTFLFLMIPFINKFISAVSQRELKKFLLTGFILLSVIPTVTLSRISFGISSGYSPFWLIYCYIVGAYLKKFDGKGQKNGVLYFVGNVLTVFFIWNVILYINKVYEFALEPALLAQYISPFMLANAVILLRIFRSMRIQSSGLKKIVLSASNAAFGVYIIHCHLIIFDYFLWDAFKWISSKSVLVAVASILCSIISIYLVCWCVEIIRKKAFQICASIVIATKV